ANPTKADKKKPEDENDTSKKKLTKSKKAQITKTEMNEDASTSNVKKSVAVKTAGKDYKPSRRRGL
ncbi:hypothetical protein MTP99_004884, partial [Tenebrio molitor]